MVIGSRRLDIVGEERKVGRVDNYNTLRLQQGIFKHRQCTGRELKWHFYL